MRFLTLGAVAVLTMTSATFSSAIGSIAIADQAQALQTLIAGRQPGTLVRNIDSDAADRTRLANRTQMLTQRVAAAACAYASGVAKDESYAFLEEAMHEMDIILSALRDGNDALHVLGPETSKRILHDLDAFDAEWSSTHPAIEDLLQDQNIANSAHEVLSHNLALLDMSVKLSTDISSAYGNPYEITQADLMLLQLAGRQTMLTQKMAKDACEIWSDDFAELGREDLVQTMQIFDGSMRALRDGRPELGIRPAPTPEIVADLDDILGRWDVLRGNLDTLAAGGTLSEDEKYEIIHDFNLELAAIDHLVLDYAAYAERHH